MRAAARPLRLLVPLLLVLAACQPSTPSSSSPSEAPPSQPAPSGSDAALCDPGVVCDGPLRAGNYVSETTGARVAFALDDHDWSGLQDTAGDGFGLFLADIPDTAISVVAFSGESFTDACDPNAGTSTTGTTPADFMAVLTTRTGVAASPPTEVSVGGRAGLQTDLTTAIDAVCGASGGGRIWLWTLPVHGDFHFNDQETARVVAVDGGSATVILVAEAFSGVDYDHFLEHFTELVETMTITPL